VLLCDFGAQKNEKLYTIIIWSEQGSILYRLSHGKFKIAHAALCLPCSDSQLDATCKACTAFIKLKKMETFQRSGKTKAEADIVLFAPQR
jgi:hypothetical protein